MMIQDWIKSWALPEYDFLNFNEPITSKYKDRCLEVYNKKLEILDRAQKEKKLNNFIVIRSIAKSPLLYLKFFYGITLRWYQDLMVSDPHPYKIFVGANQVIGKSFALNAMALYNFDKDFGYAHNEAIISINKDQAKYQMARIKDFQKISKFDTEKDKEEDNVFIITKKINDDKGSYKYSNRIIVAPHTVGSLGYDIHKLNLDEFDFWDTDTEYAFNQYLQPRTYETMKLGRAQIIIYSNPNGFDSTMHKLTNQRFPDGTLKWHTYAFNYWDSPNANDLDFNTKSLGLNRRQVESTLLGIFSTGERSYFSEEEIKDSLDTELERIKHVACIGKYMFFFLDVGSTHDQSVLTGGFVEPNEKNPDLVDIFVTIIHKYPVGYPITRVVGSSNEKHIIDGWHYEKSVKDYLDEYKQGGMYPRFGCDVTGNSGISPLFQSIGIVPEDIIFSGPAKSGYYQKFKTMMEQRRLHRVKDSDWENQARWLMAVKSVRGYLQIHNLNHFLKKGMMKGNKTKEDLDDCMDSTAGLIYLANPFDEIEPSLVTF